jgi:hypothetical protein
MKMKSAEISIENLDSIKFEIISPSLAQKIDARGL